MYRSCAAMSQCKGAPPTGHPAMWSTQTSGRRRSSTIYSQQAQRTCSWWWTRSRGSERTTSKPRLLLSQMAAMQTAKPPKVLSLPFSIGFLPVCSPTPLLPCASPFVRVCVHACAPAPVCLCAWGGLDRHRVSEEPRAPMPSYPLHC